MDDDKLQSLQAAGWALATSALLAVMLMHNHPHGGDGAGPARAVHGGLLALIVVQPAVMALVARALGWTFPAALGLTLFAIGTCGALMAGTINGFVTPALWEYPAGTIGPGVRELAWELNQQFARNGAVAAGTGITLFGVALWRAEWRVIGALGMLAGATPAVMLVAGIMDMHFYGAMITYIVHLGWLVALGAMLGYRAGKVA